MLQGVLSHHALFILYPGLDKDFTYYWMRPDRRYNSNAVSCPNCKRDLQIQISMKKDADCVARHKTLDEEKACGLLQFISQGPRQ